MNGAHCIQLNRPRHDISPVVSNVSNVLPPRNLFIIFFFWSLPEARINCANNWKRSRPSREYYAWRLRRIHASVRNMRHPTLPWRPHCMLFALLCCFLITTIDLIFIYCVVLLSLFYNFLKSKTLDSFVSATAQIITDQYAFSHSIGPSLNESLSGSNWRPLYHRRVKSRYSNIRV